MYYIFFERALAGAWCAIGALLLMQMYIKMLYYTLLNCDSDHGIDVTF
jgi:hypothetical protein